MKFSKEKIKKLSIPFSEVKKEFEKNPARKRAIQSEIKYYRMLMKLRETREKKHITQTKLAHLSGVPRTTIVKIESGRRNTTIETLMKLAEAMGKTLEIRLK
jgi:DNA-binding XRE family transcriptional regulator